MVNLKDEEMMSFFINDSLEALEEMTEAALEVEKDPSCKECIDKIFRSVHSIKGSSGILEFDKLKDISHILESILEKIRSDKININNDVIEFIIFSIGIMEKIIYFIKEEKDEMSNEEFFKITGTTIEKEQKKMEKLLDFMNNLELESEMVDEMLSGKEIVINQNILNAVKNNLYRVIVYLNDNEILKQIRMYVVYNKLLELGKVLKSNPSENLLDTDDLIDIALKGEFILDSKEKKDLIESELKEINLKIIEVTLIKRDIEEINIRDINIENKEEIKAMGLSNKKNKKSDIKIREYIKVEKEKLDLLFNVVGELFIEKSIYNQINIKLGDLYSDFTGENSHYNKNKMLANLTDEFSLLNKSQERTLNSLQTISNSLRMVSIKETFSKFPIAVRNIGKLLNKNVTLELKGEDTELDKIISEKLTDPLLHMIRNSIDHGIESSDERKKIGKPEFGKITLSAFNSGNKVIIMIEDDGRGMNSSKIADKALQKRLITNDEYYNMTDEEKLNLIFLPGFSTADEVSEISGRGIGMNVVKKNIESLKGNLEIESRLGKGAVIKIELPLTLAIVRSLLVKVNETIYSLPSDAVVTIEKVIPENLEIVNDIRCMKFREEVVPIIKIDDFFEIAKIESKEEELKIVVIKNNNKYFGIEVDEFLNQQYIVVKNIEGTYHKGNHILGIAVLGDGRLTLVIDINNIINDFNANKILRRSNNEDINC